jgi:hypothetical protein
MRCRAARRGIRAGPRRRRQSCPQTAPWWERAGPRRRALVRRASCLVCCLPFGTTEKAARASEGCPSRRPRRRNAPASQRCTHGNGTRGSPRWQSLFGKRAGVLTHVHTKIPPGSFRTRTRRGLSVACHALDSALSSGSLLALCWSACTNNSAGVSFITALRS